MRFFPLAGTAADDAALKTEYKAGRPIGAVRLGETRLYFRARRKIWYVPYECVTRAFRRVMLVSARMCCGRGNLSVENLVLCGAEDQEIAQIQLPGERAGKILLEELKKKMPGIPFTCPPKQGSPDDEEEPRLRHV